MSGLHLAERVNDVDEQQQMTKTVIGGHHATQVNNKLLNVRHNRHFVWLTGYDRNHAVSTSSQLLCERLMNSSAGIVFMHGGSEVLSHID